MAVGSGVPYEFAVGNGVTRVFAFGFTLLDESDFEALIDGIETGAYTLSGIGNVDGGSCTFDTAPASGAEITMRRSVVRQRLVDFQDNGDLPAESLNLDADRLLMMVQEVDAVASGSLRVPYPEPVSEFPAAGTRRNRMPVFTDTEAADAGVSSFSVDQVSAAIAAAYAAGSTADAVTFMQTATVTFARSVQAKLREHITVTDFAPEDIDIGDGNPHPLSDVYATLAEAQADYPHATSLTNQFAWAAIQMALDYAATIAGGTSWDGTGVGVEVPYGSYYTGLMSILHNSPGICLYGRGRGSRIFTDEDIECIVMGDSTDATSVLEIHLQDLFIANTATDNTGVGVALYRAGSGSITGCTFRNWDVQIDTHRANRMMFTLNNTNSARTVKGKAHLRIAGSASGNGGGLHVINNEWGNSSTAILPDYEDGILVQGVDGLYLTSNHTRDSNYGMRVAPDGTTGKDSITEIIGTANYFDEVYEKSVSLEGTVVAGSLYQAIQIRGGTLRCGNASGGASYGEFCFDLAVTDGGGFAGGGGQVRNILVDGNELRQARQTAIRVQGSSSGKLEVAGLRITNNFLRDHNIAGGSATSCMSIEAESALIAHNSIQADSVAATQAIRVNVSSADSGSPSLIMHDNDASNSNCTGDPFTWTTVSGALINVHNNLRPGKGKRVKEDFKATTTIREARILWQAVVEEGQVGSVHTWTEGTNTSGTAGQYRAYSEIRTGFYRQAAGGATLQHTSTVASSGNLTSNDYPIALTLLTGTAWVAGAGATAGDRITSGGRLYLALVTGTLDASTAPTHTSSTVANGTVPLAYISDVAANTLALISCGMAATDMTWMGSVDYRATP